MSEHLKTSRTLANLTSNMDSPLYMSPTGPLHHSTLFYHLLLCHLALTAYGDSSKRHSSRSTDY